MTRTTKIIKTLTTKEDAVLAMDKFASATLELKRIDNLAEKAVNRIKNKHASAIEQHNNTLKTATDTLSNFAQSNPQLFIEKKTYQMEYGNIGFRTGKPKVEKGTKTTWDKLVPWFKSIGLTRFVRHKEEVNKNLIIESRNDSAVMEKLAQQQISVQQSEHFFVETTELGSL